MRDCVHGRVAGSVREWESTCLPAGHLEAGGPGSSSEATAAATAAQPGTPGCTYSGRLRIGSGAASQRTERDGQGGAGYRNSVAGAGPPKAENHWREQ